MTNFTSPLIQKILSTQERGALRLFDRIISAELSRLHLSGHLLNLTHNIHAADGGVDAYLEEIEDGQITFLPQGSSYFQIKTGTSTNLDQSAVRKDLLVNSDGTDLKPKIRKCFEEGGTFVVVTFGWDGPADTTELKRKFQSSLDEITSDYQSVSIEILTANQILRIIEQSLSLSLDLLDLSRTNMLTHEKWGASLLFDYNTDYFDDDQILRYISAVREGIELYKFSRVLGLAGVGKTRLVYEALKDESYRESVIYFSDPDLFFNDEAAARIRNNENVPPTIIVIDECSQDDYLRINQKYKDAPSEIKFVTLFNEDETESKSAQYHFIDEVSSDIITKIIKAYGHPAGIAQKWALGCGGSPRVAHEIGVSLSTDSKNPLSPGEFDLFWERMIAGKRSLEAEDVKNDIELLMALALFKRLGYQGRNSDEFDYVYETFIHQVTDLSKVAISRRIDYLRRRKILQGTKTLYISPAYLHFWLWQQWWDRHPRLIDIKKVFSMPKQLLEWFFEMFRYAFQVPETKNLAVELLSDDSAWRTSPYFNSETGRKVFSALSSAFPDLGLKYIEDKIGNDTIANLKQFKHGRREVVWALEKSARWREHFEDSAKVLSLLALSENESYGNNATGIFINLFSHGYAHKATTETPPVERFPILESLIESDDHGKIALGLSCIEKGLKSQNILVFSQGVNLFAPQPEHWIPSDHLEVKESYHRIWRLLIQEISRLSGDLLNTAVQIALDNSTEVALIEGLQSQVLSDIRQIVIAHPAHKKAVIRRVSKAIHYGPSWGLHDLEEWQILYNDLLGDKYHDRLVRYVGMRLIEDEFDGHKKDKEHIEGEVKRLVDEAINDPPIMLNELNWLVTTRAERAYEFGYKLGQMDTKRLFLQPLLEALRSSENDTSATIVGVYLRALNEADNELWWQCTDNIYNDEALRVHYLDVIFYSGLNDKTASRVLSLVKQDLIGFERLRLFIGGRATEPLSPSALDEWLVYLIECDEFWAVGTAIELAAMYSFHKDPKMDLPVDTLFRMITHQALFFNKDRANSGTMVAFEWHQIAVRLFKREDRVRDDLLSKILSFLEDQNAVLNDFEFYTYECLNEFATVDPNLTWEKIHPYLADPASSAYYILQQWLNGSYIHRKAEPGIKYFDPSGILSWCEEDSENRAKILADIVPPDYDSDFPWLRTILEKYGSDEEVRGILHSSYTGGSYAGPSSAHHLKKVRATEEYLAKEEKNHPLVARWAMERIEYLKRWANNALDEEERRGY